MHVSGAFAGRLATRAEKKTVSGECPVGNSALPPRCLPAASRVPSLVGCKSLHCCRGWWRLAAVSGFELDADEQGRRREKTDLVPWVGNRRLGG